MLRAIKTEAFNSWLCKLRDRNAKARIVTQIKRIQNAETYIGDWKPIGDGIIEVRIDSGPGYRVYLVKEREKLLVLLAGGDKGSQERDIAVAKRELVKWKRRKDGSSDGI